MTQTKLPAEIVYELGEIDGEFTLSTGGFLEKLGTKGYRRSCIRRKTLLNGIVVDEEVVAILGAVKGSGTTEFLNWINFVKAGGKIGLGCFR